MDSRTYQGTICLDYNSIRYCVCNLSYTIFQDDSFEYVFEPNYFVIDLLSSSVFQGIPGLNLDLREKQYVRKNLTPVFISERVPQKNREDLYTLLNEIGLDYLNPIEYLLRTNKRYGGDNFYLIPFHFKETINLDNDAISKNNVFGLNKIILDYLAAGDNVIYASTLIDDTNRKNFFNVLNAMYCKTLESRNISRNIGIQKAKEENKYKGRKPITVDILLFKDCLDKIENHLMSVKEACELLGISIDKFYRVKKSINNVKD